MLKEKVLLINQTQNYTKLHSLHKCQITKIKSKNSQDGLWLFGRIRLQRQKLALRQCSKSWNIRKRPILKYSIKVNGPVPIVVLTSWVIETLIHDVGVAVQDEGCWAAPGFQQRLPHTAWVWWERAEDGPDLVGPGEHTLEGQLHGLDAPLHCL